MPKTLERLHQVFDKARFAAAGTRKAAVKGDDVETWGEWMPAVMFQHKSVFWELTDSVVLTP